MTLPLALDRNFEQQARPIPMRERGQLPPQRQEGGSEMADDTQDVPASATPAAPPAQADVPERDDPGEGGSVESVNPAAPPAQAGAPGETMVVAAAQVRDQYGILAEGAVAVEGDSALVVARFANTSAARSVYDGLLSAEIDGSLHIDGVLVVKADDDGRIRVEKMTEHSTRNGLMWGVVGGVVAAVFLPATLVAGAVALGTAGAAAGKARNLKRRLDVENELKGVITPGTSGILALVTAKEAPEVEARMPEAQAVTTVPVDKETAEAIKEAASGAEAVAPSGS
jgi:uncharacterized membrane protein